NGVAPRRGEPRPGWARSRSQRPQPDHGARAMRAALRSAWASRGARERVALIALAAIVGVAAYAWLLHSAGRGREQLRASVAILHTQGALLERQAAEHDRLRAAPAAPASQTDLRALV